MAQITLELDEDPQSLEVHLAPWAELAERSIDRNVFFEPAFLLPSLRHLAPRDGSVATLLAWRRSAADRERVGLLPIERTRRTKGLPVRSIGGWRHDQCFLGSPLLDAEYAEAALRAILAWGRAQGRAARLMRFERVYGDGPSAALIERVFAPGATRPFVDESYQRPFYRPAASLDAYLRGHLSPDRRRRIDRFRRRLERIGTLSCTAANAPEDIDAFAREFLRLEGSGWKGRSGTSLSATRPTADFLREVFRGFAAVGRLAIVELRLDDQPIAMRTSLLAGSGGFAFKTAYDEAHARNSPGVLVEVEHLRWLLDRPEIRWMDSCATATSSPVQWLWSDSRTVRTLLVPLRGRIGRLILRALPGLKAIALRYRGYRRSR